MIALDVTGTVGRAIGDYVGETPSALACVPDQMVPGTYALRATFADGHHADFLTVGVLLHLLTDEDLAEVEFTTWPPSAGAPTFFV